MLECVAFLDASRLDWYICRQIIHSILLQHPDFSSVPVTGGGATLYSVLDTKTALQRLESICPPYEDSEHPPISRRELLLYCLLDVAHRLVVRSTSLPPKSYLDLAEASFDVGSKIIDFKAKTIFCVLENSANSLLAKYTLGTLPFTNSDLDMALGLRSAAARLVSKNRSRQQLHFDSAVRESFKRKFDFGRQINSPSPEHRDAIHLEIIKLQDMLTTTGQLPFPDRVHHYFRDNDLEPLICPISQRPMTEAVYLRCGKTVNLAALEELIAGDIPETHCCCDEIHIDIEHKLHDSPLVSDLAIRHLSRALTPVEVVRYGDLPTLRHIFPEIREDDKVDLLHASLKNVAMLTFLLNNGVKADAPKDGVTALMTTSSQGSIDSVVTLLHFGAEPDARDPLGVSSIMFALRNEKPAVAETLLSKISGVPIDLLLSGDTEIPPESVDRSATALHDFYLGLQKYDKEGSLCYLQRAMELDPENHLYAEEMQVYLDDQEVRESKRTYVKREGIPFAFHS
jgi:ankyrin repeat protein